MSTPSPPYPDDPRQDPYQNRPAGGPAPDDGYGPPGYAPPPSSAAYGQQPAYGQPAYGQPGSAQPGYDQPGYQPGYGQPAAYGSPGYPGYPGGQAELQAPPTRPGTVNGAFWCWVLTALVSLVSGLLTFTSAVWNDAMAYGREQAALRGVATTDFETAITIAKVVAVVVALLFLALYLLFAFKMRAGRNWARIVLTILAAFTLLSTIAPTTRTVTVNNQIYEVQAGRGVGFVSVALALIGIVLMYVGPSNEYFRLSRFFRAGEAIRRR